MAAKNMQLIAYNLGLLEYQQSWDLQNRLAEEIAQGQHPPALLLLEHPHSYTFGRQGNTENLLWSQAELDQRGIATHWTDRGGDVTYHGPGQLVGYPIIPLENHGTDSRPKRDLVGYLRKLETTLINTLFEYRLPAEQIPGLTGVWVRPEMLGRCDHTPPERLKSPAKIASIGVRVDARGVTRHGFALNVSSEMSYWEGIVACGLENQNKTSMEMVLEETPAVEEVGRTAALNFANQMGMELVWKHSLSLGVENV
ncbi:MAG: lipoyl(octanoyl) transferase LipB [Chloroflexota bacterium]